MADRLGQKGTLPLPKDAWYENTRPTFANALVVVHQHYWRQAGFRVSGPKEHLAKLPEHLRECLSYALCRAA